MGENSRPELREATDSNLENTNRRKGPLSSLLDDAV